MIYVFGESFSQDYSKNDETSALKNYLHYKGYNIKLYVDLLGRYVNQPMINYSVGGMCNEYILTKFMENYHKIQPNDIVVFGWTDVTRFMYIHEDRWTTNIFKTDKLSNFAKDEMKVIRSHKLYEKKQLDIIKFIDKILPNNTTIHWTWSTIPSEHSLTITKETNGEIIDNHYGEDGHRDLYNKIIEQLKITNRVRINLWKFNDSTTDKYDKRVI
jgi:hypothetical protein